MNNAGLPGTGLGGFFYIFMAFTMPFYELYLTIQGKSSPSRWKLVAKQLFIAIGILAGVEAAAWMASKLFNLQKPTVAILGGSSFMPNLFLATPMLLSFAVLLVILGIIRIWAFAYKLRESRLEYTGEFSDTGNDT